MTKSKQRLLLHIYPQTDHHSAVGIVGNRAALRMLANTINKVLADDTLFRGEMTFTPIDGEAYDVYIRCVSDESMMERKLPYREFWPPKTDTESETEDDAES